MADNDPGLQDETQELKNERPASDVDAMEATSEDLDEDDDDMDDDAKPDVQPDPDTAILL